MHPFTDTNPARAIAAVLTIAAAIILSAFSPPSTTAARAACSTHENQAAAQAAADTADPDGDGRYCESLPCPCAGDTGPGQPPTPASSAPTPRACTRPDGVQPVSFNATKYPTIKAHTEAAIAAGWPEVLTVNRSGATARRARLMAASGMPTRDGYDRDEYPPAVGRGRGEGLERGTNPRGWQADLAYVPSGENSSHGATLKTKIQRFCDGTRFRYLFY